MQDLFLLLISYKGDEGQQQTATTADVMLALPLALGLLDTQVEVLILPLKARPPCNSRHHQHREQHDQADNHQHDKGLVIDQRSTIFGIIKQITHAIVTALSLMNGCIIPYFFYKNKP